jgi:4a-hydroxytetrahydrobiopterin dehydratase
MHWPAFGWNMAGRASALTPDLLSPSDIGRELRTLPRWREEPGGLALLRDYQFHCFQDAIGFMGLVARRCDAMNHHPEWTNIHDRLRVRLTTQDAGGVTMRDIALAQAFERTYWDTFRGAPPA